MRNKDKQRAKRIRNLVVTTVLTAVLLSVSTYAWFIGMRTVSVSAFDVQIASTDSLLLSIDGQNWSETIEIDSTNYKTAAYEGNTNNWAGRGLIPMSTTGELDGTASRMKLYEKASLTPTPGGYRLLASRVDNFNEDQPEQDGYVVFDLFIKNHTGAQYIKALEPLDEEAIYLTVDSEVTVAAQGAGGVAETGIENSVRVGFAQIGRVAGTTNTAELITGITCEPGEESDVTGICRKAQIWEPNDRDHVENAIRWYETSCLKRTGADLRVPESFAGDCGTVVNGQNYPTYAVKKAVTSADRVDIYDGAVYNGYAASNEFLDPVNTFTDSKKLREGTARPEFLSLAPSSITKVRIYIWIEGQDIDNYEFAAIGRAITLNFGFTKERFEGVDIDYDGPDLNQGQGPAGADLTPPVITLNGAATMTITKGGEYDEPGATVTDNVSEDLQVVITGVVNTDQVGEYLIIYSAADGAGNRATRTRKVIVEE